MKPRRKFVMIECETTLSNDRLAIEAKGGLDWDATVVRVIQVTVNAARPEKAKRGRKGKR